MLLILATDMRVKTSGEYGSDYESSACCYIPEERDSNAQ
jgi:hypothetical protein